MTTLHSVMIVARTEAKLFARSWIFRFLMVFTVLILGFLSWGFFITGQGGWMIRSMPSSFPYFLCLMLVIFETLVVIFGSVESIQRDRRFNTFASLHTRDITNLGYVTGKVIGVLMPCLILNAVFILAAIVVDVVFIGDVAYSWQSYILYPLLLMMPALLFTAGMSVLIASLVTSMPLSLAIMVGYFALTFFLRDGIFARLIDFNAMHLPFMLSSIIGSGDWAALLAQRVMFLVLGIGAILETGLAFQRLPQSLAFRRFSRVAVTACVAIAVLAGTSFVSGITRGIRLRERVAALNDEYASHPRARMVACGLDIVHNGSSLDVEAALTLMNHHDAPLNAVVLSLNPGFTVRSVRMNGAELPFVRDTQIIEVPLPSPLEPGGEAVLTVAYDGTVDDEACYPDVDPAERIGTDRVFTYVIDRRYGFVTDDYVLITPECQWYPSSGIPYGLVFPDAYERDFTEFTIDIETSNGLTVVSQGAVEGSSGRFTIRPETKLPGLTLAVGDFEKRSVEVDGVEVALYNQKGHFFFEMSEPFESDIVASGLKALKDEYEYNKKMKYPFKSYSVIESPLQFHAFERPWKTYMETIQPQVAIVPERGFFISRLRNTMFDVSAQLEAYKRAGIPNPPPAEQLMASTVRSYLYDIFMSDRAQRDSARARRSRGNTLINMDWIRNPISESYIPGYTMSVQYYPYITSFESERYPVFNTMIEFYRKHGLNTNTNINSRQSKPLFDEEVACMALQEASFEDYLKEGTDFDTMNLLLMLKANHLFGALQAVIGEDGFDTFLNEYIPAHAFENVSYEQFAADVETRFGVNLDETFETWFSESRLPLFEVSDVSLTEIVVDEHIRYQTTMKITNIEPVPGTVWVQVRMGGSGNSIDRTTRFITLSGNQTKEIGFVTDTAPPDMEVNGLISKNLPLVYSRNLGSPREDHDAEPFEGERIVEYSPNMPEPGTIVVDNLEAGFELVCNPADIDDGQSVQIYQFGKYPGDFIAPVLSRPPKRWGKTIIPSAYGAQKVAYYTKGGSGDGKVAWHADIPEAGRYDLEYYMYDDGSGSISGGTITAVSVNGQMVVTSAAGAGAVSIEMVDGQPVLRQQKLFEDYHLTVANGARENEITYMPQQNQPGWQYVGTFDLEAGQTDVCLCNKSEGKLIYADAIRWVKK